ncbi:MAG: cache domain-containing protein [Myxococcota bacterium]|nr:cache domain-containing protein [Myxococcota bacterium]
MDRRRFSRRDLLTLAAAVTLVTSVAFLLRPSAERALEPTSVADRLVAELDRRLGAIARWEQDVRGAVERAADRERLRHEVRAALEGRPNQLDRALVRSCERLDGCAVVTADGERLASLHADDVPPSLVQRALRGRTVRSRLLATDAKGQRDGAAGLPRPSVLFATPLVTDGEVRAVLVGRARPDRQLDPLLRDHPLGRTGETYVVDARGFMITRSRFDPPARRVPHAPLVLDRPAVALLTPHEEPTRAFAAARAGHDGVDVTGYLDYRGVPVVGAWRWLDDLGAGVITEMDRVEAYRANSPR